MRVLNEPNAAAGLGHIHGGPVGESLAAWIVDGGGGRLDVGLKDERLIVQTVEGASSKASVVLDWPRVAGDPIMRRVQLVPIETSTAAAAGGSAVAGEYLANGAARSAPGKHYRKGITLAEFFRMFPDAAAAEAWFASTRWPDGPRCPHCDSGRIQSKSAHKTLP